MENRARDFIERQKGYFPDQLGLEPVEVRRGYASMRMAVSPKLLAPHDVLYAGIVVMLADVCAGYGCRASLPEGATGFTTIELKSNFLATARDGTIECEARAIHLGKSTQVWDAVVTASGKTIALFRCTQMVLR